MTQTETDLPCGILSDWNDVPMLHAGVVIDADRLEAQKFTGEFAISMNFWRLILTLPVVEEFRSCFCACDEQSRCVLLACVGQGVLFYCKLWSWASGRQRPKK